MSGDRQHEYFGRLSYVAEANALQAVLRNDTGTVQLTLALSGCTDEAAFLSAAEAFCRELPAWRRRVQDFAAEKLLAMKNDSWLEAHEKKLTPKAFGRRMKLKSITLTPDGRFTFMHDDGDLFWGHPIQVIGSRDEGPQAADLPS